MKVRGIDRSIKRLAQPGRVKHCPAARELARREERNLKRDIQEELHEHAKQ